MEARTMYTINKQRRESDGAVICSDCNNIIPEGHAYVQDTSSYGGICIERETCLECLAKDERRDAASWLMVVAACIASLGIFAVMVMG
jgi:hypothetical protein